MFPLQTLYNCAAKQFRFFPLHFFLAYARTRRLRLLFASRYLDFEFRRPRETLLRSSPPLHLPALHKSTFARVLRPAHRAVHKDHVALSLKTRKLRFTDSPPSLCARSSSSLPKLSPCHRFRLRLGPAHPSLFGGRATAGLHGGPVTLRCVMLSCVASSAS